MCNVVVVLAGGGSAGVCVCVCDVVLGLVCVYDVRVVVCMVW